MRTQTPLDTQPHGGHTSHAGAESDNTLAARGLYRLGTAYGRLVYRLRWLILALWLGVFAVSLPFSARLASVLTATSSLPSNNEAVRVDHLVIDKLGQPRTQALVVFQSADTPVSDPAYQREVDDFISRAHTFDHVTGVAQNSVGRDGRTTVVAVNFDQDATRLLPKVADFRKLVPTGDSAKPARAYLTGTPGVYDEFNQIAQHDLGHAESLAFPLLLVVLLVVFGTLISAATPLLLAFVAVPVALAMIYAVALHFETTVFVLNIATIIGLGLSIDYSLFMTRRFREELAAGRTTREAIAWTVATSGEAILFSGLTVFIGFAGLLLIRVSAMQSFGIGGMAVVAAAVLAALTLLPALLSVLGTRVNALRLPLLGKLAAPRRPVGEDERPGFWHRWALGVMRRPALVILVALVALFALSAPLGSLNLGKPDSSALPATSEARTGYDILTAQYPAASEMPVYIIAQAADGSSMLSAENLAKLDAFSQWLAQQPHVMSVTSLTHLPAPAGAAGAAIPDQAQLAQLYSSGAYQSDPALAKFVAATTAGDTTLLTLKSDTKLDTVEGKALIDHLRATRDAGHGLTVLVGGAQALELDLNRYIYDDFPRAVVFIVVATYLLLLLLFRSVLLPLKAVAMNVLSVCAAYGGLVFVFQQGHFEHVLGFTSPGSVDSTLPILLFCILFGLSMDYEVFLLSRIREEWLRTGDNTHAVARGLEKTAGVITSAALLFVTVSVSFIFTTLINTKEIGFGLTVAVLVDATIIRTLLVPATMRLLGRWNWWLPGQRLAAGR